MGSFYQVWGLVRLNLIFINMNQFFVHVLHLSAVLAVPLPQENIQAGFALQAEDLSNDQVVEEQQTRSGRDFGNIASILAIAGAKPQEVEFSGSYRKKRQVTEEMFEQEVENSFLHQAEDLSNDPVVADQLSRSGRDFGDIASILAIAGAKPQEVDFSGSYSGRKKRQVTEEMFEQEVENSFLHQAEDLSNDPVVADQLSRSGRDFGDIASILAIAGATPQEVDFSGSYSGRKKRQVTGNVFGNSQEAFDQDSRTDTTAQQETRSGRDFGNIASILAIAGAEPVEVDLNGSYTGRKKRQTGEEDSDSFLADVNLKSVKVKPHGKYGNLAQESIKGVMTSRAVFDQAYN